MKNPYIAATFILLVVCIAFGYAIYQNQYYQLGEVKIEKNLVEQMSNNFEGKPFQLCEEDSCVAIFKLP